MTPRRLFGFSEAWHRDGTGERDFYLFFVRVYHGTFWHSTTFIPDDRATWEREPPRGGECW